MKINFQKIIAVISVVCLTALIIPFSAFASEPMSSKDYRSSCSWIIAQYKDGKISYNQFQEQIQSVTNEYVNSNTFGGVVESSVLNTSNTISAISQKIGATINQYGDSARDYISAWISDLMKSYEVLREESNTDMNGYGAKAYIRNTSWGLVHVYYADYIEVREPYFFLYNEHARQYPSGEIIYKDYSGFSGSLPLEYYYLYGDVRYDDGSPAPTDDVFTEVHDYDFSNATDKELDELLKKILNVLELQNPDLTNIEGLLQAIYNRLGTLDSDNDNAALNEINAAIIALARDGQSQNAALIKVLQELKEAVKNGTGFSGDSEEGKEGESGNSSSDNKYLKDILDELKDVSGTLKGLALIEVADNLLDLTDSEAKLFDQYADLIPLLVNKVGFGAVTLVMADIESVMFTNVPPSDLTVNIFGDDYVLLSTSMFTPESMRYITLGKTFISVILVYSWCMMMRKRLAGG